MRGFLWSPVMNIVLSVTWVMLTMQTTVKEWQHVTEKLNHVEAGLGGIHRDTPILVTRLTQSDLILLIPLWAALSSVARVSLLVTTTVLESV